MSLTSADRVDQRLVYGLFAVLVVAKLGDVLTTIVGLQQPGVVELNPLVRAVQHALGPTVGTVLATVGLGGLVLAVLELQARLVGLWWPTYAGWYRVGAYAGLALLWVGIVAHNMVILT